jgi:hypothetical protein
LLPPDSTPPHSSGDFNTLLEPFSPDLGTRCEDWLKATAPHTTLVLLMYLILRWQDVYLDLIVTLPYYKLFI